MYKELRILILEDVPADAELMEHELHKAGIVFISRRVVTREAFLKELKDFVPDLVLADYLLPQFDGISALVIAKKQYPDVPFILVSGAIGEELAIEAIKSGATDYVLKQRLFRLVPSVRRALHEVEERAERKRAEEALSWELSVNTVIAELSSVLLAEQSLSIDDISHLVLQRARNLTQSVFGYVGYIDSETGWLGSVTLTRDVWDECNIENKSIVFKKFTGLWGWVLNNRTPLLTNTPAKDPRSSGTPPGHIQIHRFLSAPALVGEKLVGQITVANSERDYIERDLQLITRLSSIYAIAIQRKWAEEKLYYLSMHDSLTRLYNRGYFEQEMRRIEEGRYNSAGIVICDIDGLKLVNDALGHQAGDELLKAAAFVVKESFRKSDVVARIGGDEFAVMVPNADKDSIKSACLRTQYAVSEYNSAHPDLPLSISIGYAVSNKSPLKMQDIFREADNNMYKEKLRSGKKRP